jgi:hypothetical protein
MTATPFPRAPAGRLRRLPASAAFFGTSLGFFALYIAAGANGDSPPGRSPSPSPPTRSLS